MISANSRYASSQVVAATYEGQVIQVIVPSEQVAYSFSYVSYMWTDRDRLDRLAYDNYGDATQWWRIADANPQIIDWTTITAGTVIRIPFI